MAAPDVAVVGAGLAGLSAALELKSNGCRVHLYERSRLIGGRATSFEVAGREVDNGQHVFLACCTEFIRFVERAGMGENLYLQPRFDVLVFTRDGERGRLRAMRLPPPLHLAASFLTYRLLNWKARLRVIGALRSIKDALHSEQNFAAWLADRGQRRDEVRAFWEPFIVPALNAPLERIAASDAALVLWRAFFEDAGAARFGFARVPLAHIMNAAARNIDELHLSTAVLAVDIDDDGRPSVQPAGAERRSYDAIVLAVPPRQLAKVLHNSAQYGLPALDEYEPMPIIDVHLWHDRGALDFDFAALIDSPVQWIFQKEAGYICCSVSAAEQYVRLPTDELATLAWDQVRAAVSELSIASLRNSAVTRNPEATYLPKHGVIRPMQRTRRSRVAVAGSWTDTGWLDTMESAVRSGITAAQSLVLERHVA
ncbi:MAG: FAD-dependent oxidoreductase [Candidatus Eremiobacteraeota bacterium]|nr:FAD-dependent oxidoreductase [Candidatus Eremiobacteraeota bacterium]